MVHIIIQFSEIVISLDTYNVLKVFFDSKIKGLTTSTHRGKRFQDIDGNDCCDLSVYRGETGVFKMEFKFKYVNEEQLMKVMRKVQRERKLKQNFVDFGPFLTQRTGKKSSNLDQSTGVDEELNTDSTRLGDSTVHDFVGALPEKVYQPSLPVALMWNEAKENRIERVNSLVSRLRDLRRNILESLDYLVTINEQIVPKDSECNYSKGRLEEAPDDTKLNNCLCHINKLEYPFVINMRRLNLSAHKCDMNFHLKVLLECHNIALRMLKVFIRGTPHILKEDRIKEKFHRLLERMITLSSVCKVIAVEHRDLISSEDFLLDELDRKCVSLFRPEKKIIQMFTANSCERKKAESLEHERLYRRGNDITTSSCVSSNTVHVPMKKFKKLANLVLGSKDRHMKTSNREYVHQNEEGAEVINSKYKAGVFKGKRIVVGEGSKTLRTQSRPQVKSVHQHHGRNSKLSKITKTDSITNTKPLDKSVLMKNKSQETHDSLEELKEDNKPKAQESFDSAQVNSGPTNSKNILTDNENFLAKSQAEYVNLLTHSIDCDGHHASNELICHSTNSSSTREVKQQFSSFTDDARFSDIIKMSNTAGSISDKLMDECLNRIGCEIDTFVDDFVQKMFSLEFT